MPHSQKLQRANSPAIQMTGDDNIFKKLGMTLDTESKLNRLTASLNPKSEQMRIIKELINIQIMMFYSPFWVEFFRQPT